MSNSTYRAEVVELNLEKHPNADTLSLMRVGNYTVVVKTDVWKDRKKAVYIQPDSVVDTDRPEFSWVKKKDRFQRVTAKRFCGIVSYGFLAECPEDLNVGDDAAERLGVTHWNPPEETATDGQSDKAPPGVWEKYDIESARKTAYERLFKDGEPVYVTEKIHGAFARYVYIKDEDKLYVGTKNRWVKDEPSCIWWQALRNTPSINDFCRNNPGVVLNGEVYGHVKGFWYGKQKKCKFAAFDIRCGDRWFSPESFLAECKLYDVPTVPVIGEAMPFNFEEIEKLTNGPSLVPDSSNIREGVVIKPLVERYVPEIGRLFLKLVGSDYLLKS